tara:strand:- start:202 stop:468 length:267 start_codon:yes stop_codon:yes gene_type:complete
MEILVDQVVEEEQTDQILVEQEILHPLVHLKEIMVEIILFQFIQEQLVEVELELLEIMQPNVLVEMEGQDHMLLPLLVFLLVMVILVQ